MKIHGEDKKLTLKKIDKIQISFSTLSLILEIIILIKLFS